MKTKIILFLKEKTKPILRDLSAIILFPASIGATEGLSALILNYDLFNHYRYFPLGMICYLAIFILFNKPIRTYVFGHELTHALATLLFKGEVKSFKTSPYGGSVVVSKTNIIIVLSPYFFPLYTFLIIFIHFLLSGFFNLSVVFPAFVFLLGVSFCFHLILTAYMLFLGQQDIKEFGPLFSLTFIYLCNIISLCLIAAFISKPINLEIIYETLKNHIATRYINIIT